MFLFFFLLEEARIFFSVKMILNLKFKKIHVLSHIQKYVNKDAGVH